MLDDKEEKAAIQENPLIGDDKSTAPQVMDKPRTGRGKKIGVTILVIILLAATAGGVYYWQQQKAKQQQAELQSQIDTLKKQVSDAEQKVKEAAATDPTKDWKSYTLKNEKLKIKYPATWAIDSSYSISTDEIDGIQIYKSDSKSKYRVTISVLKKDSTVAKLNGASGSATDLVSDGTTFTLNSQTIYSLNAKNYAGTYLSICNNKKCLIKAKNTDGMIDAYSSYYTPGDQSVMPYNKDSVGAQEAIAILKSLSY